MTDPACETCQGTGFAYVEKEGRVFARRCACRLESRDGKRDATAGCRIPPRYEHCTLESFEPGNASLAAALEKALAFCAGYPHLGADEGLGLLFCGYALSG